MGSLARTPARSGRGRRRVAPRALLTGAAAVGESAYLYPTVFSRRAERLNPLMGCNIPLCHEASASLANPKGAGHGRFLLVPFSFAGKKMNNLYNPSRISETSPSLSPEVASFESITPATKWRPPGRENPGPPDPSPPGRCHPRRPPPAPVPRPARSAFAQKSAGS